MNLIRARFQLMYNLSEQHCGLLGYFNILQVPDLNEIVGINGNPFCVFKRGWALSKDDPIQYAYVDVLKGSNFALTIGGREY